MWGCINKLTVRPSGLREEDGLAGSDALRLSDRGPVVVGRHGDAVRLGALEVGEAVVAEPVHRGRHAGVLGQDPRRPRVDVADGLALEPRALDPVPHPADVPLDLRARRAGAGVVGHALGAAPVQVLRPDAHADDAVGERRAEVLLGRQEGIELVLVDGPARARPQAHEDRRVRVDGGLEGADGIGRRAALDRGVEAGRGEALGAREVLSSVEKVHEVAV